MKKFYFLITAIFVTTYLFGQNLNYDNDIMPTSANKKSLYECFSFYNRFSHFNLKEKYPFKSDTALALDSMIIISNYKDKTGKDEYLYDSLGNVIRYTPYGIENGNYIPYYREENKYNSQSQIIEKIIYYWLSPQKKLLPSNKTEYVYEQNLYTVLESYYDVDSEKWYLQSKTLTYYNNFGKEDSILNYNYNLSDSSWTLNFVSTYFYNSAQLIDSMLSISVIFPDKQYQYNWKDVYEYDSNYFLIIFNDFYWNYDSLRWENMTLIEYENNPDGLPLSVSHFFWNIDSLNFYEMYKEVYEYDTNSNLITEKYFYTDSVGNLFEGSRVESKYDSNNYIYQKILWSSQNVYPEKEIFMTEKDLYFYDELYNRTRNELYFWDSLANEWIISQKAEFTFDTLHHYMDLFVPEYYDFEYKIDRIVESYYESGQWNELYNYSFYYSPFHIVKTPFIEDKKIRVFPVPAKDYIIIDAEINSKLEIFNIKAQKVYSKEITNDKVINISNLSSGTYIFYVIENNKKYTGKFIKN